MTDNECGGCFYSGGTNTAYPPNWTTYDGNGSGCNCTSNQTGNNNNELINYPTNFTTTNDPGVNSFLNQVFGSNSIGGAIQWVNGTYQG